MQVVGYTRLSRAKEAGVSLAAQGQAIRRACKEKGWELVEIVEDEGQGGASLKRPGVKRALLLMEGEGGGGATPDVLMVARLDRLSRSVRDFANLLHMAEFRGWEVVALDMGVDTTTPEGRLLAHILMAAAEFERALIGKRTKEALAYKKGQGVKLGRRRNVPDSVIERIQHMRSEGMKPGAISRQLNKESIPASEGGKWYPEAIRRIFRWA